jgi:hypothetical protein
MNPAYSLTMPARSLHHSGKYHASRGFYLLICLHSIMIIRCQSVHRIFGELHCDALDELRLVRDLATLVDGSLLCRVELCS